MTLSNVPNTAMLTGTARTSVGTRPRQNTRPPPLPGSAYIFCAARHDEPSPVSASAPNVVIAPACKRVLRTSKGNVAIHPIMPAAAPATSGAAQWRRGRGGRASESTRGESGCDGAGVGVGIGIGCTDVGEKRRSVPSYCLLHEAFFSGAWEAQDPRTHPVEV
jgi:hypothetical protein